MRGKVSDCTVSKRVFLRQRTKRKVREGKDRKNVLYRIRSEGTPNLGTSGLVNPTSYTFLSHPLVVTTDTKYLKSRERVGGETRSVEICESKILIP